MNIHIRASSLQRLIRAGWNYKIQHNRGLQVSTQDWGSWKKACRKALWPARWLRAASIWLTSSKGVNVLCCTASLIKTIYVKITLLQSISTEINWNKTIQHGLLSGRSYLCTSLLSFAPLSFSLSPEIMITFSCSALNKMTGMAMLSSY